MSERCRLDGGFPLVWTSFEGDPSLDEFEAHLTELDAHVRSRMEPYVLMVDSRLTGFGAGLRKACTDYMANNEDLNPLIAGIAMVLRSPFQRGLVTALLWVYSAPYELKAFRDRESAEAWAWERMAERRRVSG